MQKEKDKRKKKVEKEDRTQAGQTPLSATEVQSLSRKKSQVSSPRPAPLQKKVAVELVIREFHSSHRRRQPRSKGMFTLGQIYFCAGREINLLQCGLS